MTVTRLVHASVILWAFLHFPVALGSQTEVLQRYEEMLNAQAALGHRKNNRLKLGDWEVGRW